MRRVIVEVEASINGAMGSESMDFWTKLFEFQSEDVQEYLNELLFTPDALLMGKKTYQGFADIWPTRQGPDADRINSLPKYVASRTLREPLD
ncbi:MAG: dihydrofolate reductase family protein [Actinomycetota bacterium]